MQVPPCCPPPTGGVSSTESALPSEEPLSSAHWLACVMLSVVPVQWRMVATVAILWWLFLLVTDPAGCTLCVSAERLCYGLYSSTLLSRIFVC